MFVGFSASGANFRQMCTIQRMLSCIQHSFREWGQLIEVSANYFTTDDL